MKLFLAILTIPVTFFVSYLTMIHGWGVEPENISVIIGGWLLSVFLMTVMELHIAMIGTVKAIEDTGPELEANAEFIARACNSHYELLEALEELVVDDTWGLDHPTYMKCRAAIAKARGEN